MQHHPADRDEVADQCQTRRQQAHRHPIEGMTQLCSTLDQRRIAAVLFGQHQQAISQCRHRPEEEVPEDHREETLIRLPQQMPLHLLKQLLATVGADVQVALGHVGRRLQILTAPGIAERSEAAEQVATPEAVNHHQQMHRQRQQTVRHRFQHQQQQRQQRHRAQHQNRQHQPRLPGQPFAVFEFVQFADPSAVALKPMAQGRKLLDPHRQQ